MAKLFIALIIVVAAIGYTVTQLSRGVPPVVATGSASDYTLPGTAPTIAWPTTGEAAVGLQGIGVAASSGTGTQAQTPLASVTKMMTAYVILHDHPIGSTGTGPEITIGATTVATYDHDVATGDSVVAVENGEQLTEIQALEALLLPSGDNIATVLADWDASTTTSFVAKMNAAATSLGLKNTHYADASGVAGGSESTAADQVELGLTTMQTATFRAIVAMPTVTLPVAGVQHNVDTQLGKNGIIGIKTGYTTAAGACFVFAADETVGGKPTVVVGAVLHQKPSTGTTRPLGNAFTAAQALLTSVQHAFEQETVLQAGTVLGKLTSKWATTVELTATKSVTVIGMPGEKVDIKVVLPPQVNPPVAAKRHFGTAIVTFGTQGATVPIVTSRSLPAVSIMWRLTNV